MKNADLFKDTFGMYATEIWSMSEKEFLIWLNENAQPKTGHCKDCKWWKDSDGLYRRGSHAESQCPMNRIEVYEGNGYCYMFEPQERSDKE